MSPRPPGRRVRPRPGFGGAVLRAIPFLAVGAAVVIAFAPSATSAAVRVEPAPRPLDSQRAAPQDTTASCTPGARLDRIGLTGMRADFLRAAAITGAAPLRSELNRRTSTAPRVSLCAAPGSLAALARLPAPAAGEPTERPGAADSPAPASGAAAGGPLLTLLPVTWSSALNTAYPRERNDGAVWAGRGLSTAIGAGLRLRWGPVSAAFAPTVAWQQNRAFPLRPVPVPGVATTAHGGRSGTFDSPQRPGAGPFWSLHPGDSYLRIDAAGLGLGISSENLWWGPARRNPLLMSGSAPGFPHAFIGTSGPMATRLGRIEVEALWGELEESRFFDADAWNDRRLFSGLVIGFEPRGITGLFVGAARAYVGRIPVGGLALHEWIARPYAPADRTAVGDPDRAAMRLHSIFVRWVQRESGFELYGEGARQDAPAILDGNGEPVAEDPAYGYTVGLQNARPLAGGSWLRLYAEFTTLRNLPETRGIPVGTSFYTSPLLDQGYTHAGQPIGAAIGPGSDAQQIGGDLYTQWGWLGVYLERSRYDDDWYYHRWARNYGVHGHDVELTIGARQLVFLGPFDVGAGLAYGFHRNRDFARLTGGEEIGANLHDETNWTWELTLAWRPDSRLSWNLGDALSRSRR